jgi:hypothetical protein
MVLSGPMLMMVMVMMVVPKTSSSCRGLAAFGRLGIVTASAAHAQCETVLLLVD